MLTERFERLNALAEVASASTYLEIGVAKGETFSRVTVPSKVAVDPRFRFDVNAYADSDATFYEVTSDVFFAEHAAAHGSFDLIYLDGLHTCDQTFRDFCASMRHAHAQTLWLIDDTHPSGWLAAHPKRRVTQRVRRLLRSDERGWMGDVYKVVFLIHDFFPQCNYATFSDHGQTVVWLETRQDFAPTWNSLEKISRLGYQDFLRFRDSHLSIMEPSQILEAVERSRAKLA